MSKKKALGRGLEQLFDQDLLDNEDDNNIIEIEISEIVANPYQPRKNFDEEKLLELSKSIEENGVFQPIIVRRSIIGYELIAGERRLRASELAQKATIPAIVRTYTDEEMMEIALIENIQREDLTVIEEAKSLKLIIEKLDITQQELARKIGKSRTHVTNILRLLNLNDSIIDKINKKEITMGHTKILVNIEDEDLQNTLVDKIISDKLTVRAAEELVKEIKGKKNKKVKKSISEPKVESNKYDRLEKIMREKLGTKVVISGAKNGSVIIDFASEDDLERLLEIMKIV